MNEPTEEQIKKFWEWCGLKWFWNHNPDCHCGAIDDDDSERSWIYRDGDKWKLATRFYNEDMAIDLNNLFKWAKHPFVSMACGSINEEDWKGAWAKVITRDRQKIGEIREEGLTPALALFWAIYKVIKED